MKYKIISALLFTVIFAEALYAETINFGNSFFNKDRANTISKIIVITNNEDTALEYNISFTSHPSMQTSDIKTAPLTDEVYDAESKEFFSSITKDSCIQHYGETIFSLNAGQKCRLHITFSPTEVKDYNEEPDVVIFVCKPYQAMRLSHGYAYHHGYANEIKLSGMQAICEECTSYPYENGCFNVSMMCSGTRMMAGWKDDEMGVGMPYRIFIDVLDGLIKTVNPLERNKHKKIIKEKLEKNNLSDLLDIRMNENYDDSCYIGGIVENENN